MEYKYNDAAKAAGVKIASAVGFDSVPADMGTLFAVSGVEAKSTPGTAEPPAHFNTSSVLWHR